MNKLAEIEAALPTLTTVELEQLMTVVSEAKLQRVSSGRYAAVNLAKFAGVLTLPSDPLDWQRQRRDEWK